jgi:hypothetical protein
MVCLTSHCGFKDLENDFWMNRFVILWYYIRESELRSEVEETNPKPGTKNEDTNRKNSCCRWGY